MYPAHINSVCKHFPRTFRPWMRNKDKGFSNRSSQVPHGDHSTLHRLLRLSQFLWEGLQSHWYPLVTFLWSLLTLKPCRNFETSHLKPKCLLHFPAGLDRVSCVRQGIWPQASGDYLSISHLAVSMPGLQDVPHRILFVLGLRGWGGVGC